MNIDDLLLRFQPEKNSVQAEYLSYENYFRASDKAIVGRYEELKFLSEKLLERNPNIKSWLDIACGAGQLLPVLQEVNINAYGIELDHGLSLKGIEDGANIFCGEAIQVLELLVENNIQFDVVSCLHLIEHMDWDKAEKLISLIEKVLKPMGHSVIVTPNAKDLRVMAGSFYRDPTHIRPYPEELLQYLCHKNKLEPVYSETFNRFFGDEISLNKDDKITQAKQNIKMASDLMVKLKKDKLC
ncbi:bifunctional 2-polyprenyl-6-hydroxyphenol methylase/3-demethylubiquinol 3-O-methyltransferase UbiG [Methylophaga sp.]|uniref:class I SAM-dependent methyltransferase n=1 Tax=Methylophaga sp. TaxID=2024840 RepID=UPI00271EC773|nr:class I SAM-dependent methyltransferase [Methylophaga sp.]MDO8828413.1 class I SAM-dependent methyltransferase [Methylophaga sp.]